MPKTYVRKTDRAEGYSDEQLEKAVQDVKNGILSGYAASKLYKVPRMTIMNHVKGKRGQKSKTLGRSTALPPDVEETLAKCLHIMEKHGFGLTKREVLELVGKYVKTNKLQTPFKDGKPGHDWFKAFSKRWKLSLKKPQGVEIARKKACDPFKINHYFDLLHKTITDLDLTGKPENIWNADETNFSNDPEASKVVGLTGYPSTRTISSPGRDNTSVLLTCSAAGQKAPALIVYKGKYVWDEWVYKDETSLTSYASTKNGWMEAEVFTNYFHNTFLPIIGTERPVLLIYDGHSSHININVIEDAIANEVTILKIPPHSSHLLQPLDLSVMKSLKSSWEVSISRWQKLNVGCILPKNEFAKMLTSVWENMDPQVVINGFRKAGISPFNRDVISREKYDPLSLARYEKLQADQASGNIGTTTTMDTVDGGSTSGVGTIAVGIVDGGESTGGVGTIVVDTVGGGSTSGVVSIIAADNVDGESTDSVGLIAANTIDGGSNEGVGTIAMDTVDGGSTDGVVGTVDGASTSGIGSILSTSTQISKYKIQVNAIKTVIPSQYIIKTKKPSESKCDTPINGSSSIVINDCKIIRAANTSFEELLLETIKPGVHTVKKKRRVAMGAEVITSANVLERLQAAKVKDVKKVKKCVEADRKKVPKPKISKKRKPSPVTSDESNTSFCSDSSNDSKFIENETESEKENECQESVPDSSETLEGQVVHPQINDWALVKFASKNSLKHFIGTILGQSLTSQSEKYTMKFVRRASGRKRTRNVFTYPIVEDIYDVSSSDIMSILPKPTLGRRGEIMFKVSFEGFNVQ